VLHAPLGSFANTFVSNMCRANCELQLGPTFASLTQTAATSVPAQVYVHSRPDFLGYPPGHLFHGAPGCAQAACRCRRPAHSLVAKELWHSSVANQYWHCCAGYELVHRAGSGWIIATAAMYTLLKAAVDNPVNQFFVLLSEACLPMYPPAAMYLQIVHQPKSRTNGAHFHRPRGSAALYSCPSWLTGLPPQQPCHARCPAAGGCELGGLETKELFGGREVRYRRLFGCAHPRSSRCAPRWRLIRSHPP